MPTEILIAVFEGDPLDAVELRNAAIHVRYEGGEKRLYHLAGTNPLFKFTTEIGGPEKLDLQLADLSSVSTPSDTITEWMIHNACANTPIQKDLGNDWNSQNWVAEALSNLVAIGCMSEEQRLNAVNRTIDVCLKAKV